MNRRSFIKITTALAAGIAFGGSLICAPVKAVARSLGRRTCVWAGGEGHYDDPAMWVDRQMPQAGDDVVIKAGHMMLPKSGEYDMNIRTLTLIGGAMTIGSALDHPACITTIKA